MKKTTLSKKIEEKGAKIPNLSPSQALLTNIENDKDKIEKNTNEKISNKEVSNEEKNIENKTELKSKETEGNGTSVNKTQEKLLSFETKKVEDTHKRTTFLVRRDLLEQLNELAKGKHGYKTEFINYAIELGILELKKAQENKNL